VLSVKGITGVPIKYITIGEGVEAIQEFSPQRIANRILQMGDIIELVEKAQSAFNEKETQEMVASMSKGKFNLIDLKKQLEMMSKMGSMSSMMSLIPGVNKLKNKIDPSTLDDKIIKHQIAIINSMTKRERLNPDIIKAKRKIRIANGCGLTVAEVNKLLKSHKQMQTMMKKFKGGIPGFGGNAQISKDMMNQLRNFK
jgi:signal recognition particle subunit SRP54